MNKTYLACIAHDGKKSSMVHLAMSHKKVFDKYKIVATGTTGKFLEKAGLEVLQMQSGPVGGDAEIANMIVHGEVFAVIFLVDPLDVHPHQVDVSMLLRLCNVHNVPVATNEAMAEILLKTL